MQIALSTQPTMGAGPSTPALPPIDLAAPLQPMDKLDIVADGRLTTSDGAAFERLAETARAAGDATASEQLSWAGQQARYGAALLAPGAPLPTTTIHNLVPTPGLASPVTPRQLITAIKHVDTARLRAAGVRPVAAFDVDGTTLKGDIFMPFMELMATQHRFSAQANEVFRPVLAKLNVDQSAVRGNDANANALLMLSKIDPSTKVDTPTQLSIASAFFAAGDALAGLRLTDVQAVARDLMEHGVGSTPPYKQRINDDSKGAGDSAADVVGALTKKGIDPYVVTYGFEWLAQVAAPYVGFAPTHVIGTRSEVKDGVLTGKHNGREIPTKDVLVRQVTGTPPLFVFGDSGSDLPMLDIAVGRGMVVNPSPTMREKMAQRPGLLGEVRYRGTVGEPARTL